MTQYAKAKATGRLGAFVQLQAEKAKESALARKESPSILLTRDGDVSIDLGYMVHG